MTNGELLCLIFGCIAGILIVGALVLINERMKAGEAPHRPANAKPT